MRWVIFGIVALTFTQVTRPVPDTASSPSTSAPAVNVQEIILSNGFRLLVVEDHQQPRVAASLWYRFGALAEGSGEHGSAHFLEHAIHQGTTSIGTKDLEAEKPILQEIQETEQELLAVLDRDRNTLRQRQVFYDQFGWPQRPEVDRLRHRLYELEDKDAQYRDFWAEHNWYRRYGYVGRHTDAVPATTGYEQLEIDIDLPSENIELFFRIEADRMVNAVLRGWEAQRFTVLEQLRGTYSRADAPFYFALDGVKGWGHPWDFQYFNRAAMLRMYDAYFVPNNTTAVLVGDIRATNAKELAERYFGKIVRGPEPPRQMDVEAEPNVNGARRLEWAMPVDSRIIVRYRIPGIGHQDRPVFDTIVALLRGRHSILGRALYAAGDPALSTTVDVRLINMYRTGSVGAVNIVVRGQGDEDLPKIEAAILNTVQRLGEEALDPIDLERARKALRLEWAQVRGTRRSLAYALGRFQVMDKWTDLQTHMSAREQASAYDIQRIARTYLIGANRTIGVARLNPLPH